MSRWRLALHGVSREQWPRTRKGYLARAYSARGPVHGLLVRTLFFTHQEIISHASLVTMLAKATRAWLARPASTFAAHWLVLFMLLPSPVGLAAGAYYLISGQVRGGRVAALLILVYAAAATYFLVQGWRRGARIWHLVLGVLLSAPVNWVDSWINDPHLRWKFPLWTVLLAIGLAYNLCRFAIRSRRHRESEGSLPPRDPQVSAESAGAQ